MLKFNDVQKKLLFEVAEIKDVPKGAFNIRLNSVSAERHSSPNISISSKKEVSGLEVHIKADTKNETLHIPVLLTQSGLKETVYNDFYVGNGADVLIIAGCGIDNCGCDDSEHDGVHRFFVGKDARLRYVEKHIGSGDGSGKRILNPDTEVFQEEGSIVEMEMVQIMGVDDTKRTTRAELKEDAKLVIRERLMTHGSQNASSIYIVSLNGDNSSADIVSRSVAKGSSYQMFDAKIVGNSACYGHTECDSIIMDEARILAVPELEANHLDAALVHEAAIGKIAGDQIIKLMTLGLTEAEAEEQIINGFLQ